MTKILLIDNYDSFVYNIAQYMGELGASVVVERNDSPGVPQQFGEVDGYVISPGPGHPRDTNYSLEVVSRDGLDRPVLGVCLGHQAIAHVHGGSVVRANRVVHGKLSRISHVDCPIFDGVPTPFSATRYHSLVVDKETLPSSLEILAEAETEHREIMALRVRGREIFGLQFHPESVMTSHGKRMISNFLRLCRR